MVRGRRLSAPRGGARARARHHRSAAGRDEAARERSAVSRDGRARSRGDLHLRRGERQVHRSERGGGAAPRPTTGRAPDDGTDRAEPRDATRRTSNGRRLRADVASAHAGWCGRVRVDGERTPWAAAAVRGPYPRPPFDEPRPGPRKHLRRHRPAPGARAARAGAAARGRRAPRGRRRSRLQQRAEHHPRLHAARAERAAADPQSARRPARRRQRRRARGARHPAAPRVRPQAGGCSPCPRPHGTHRAREAGPRAARRRRRRDRAPARAAPRQRPHRPRPRRADHLEPRGQRARRDAGRRAHHDRHRERLPRQGVRAPAQRRAPGTLRDAERGRHG